MLSGGSICRTTFHNFNPTSKLRLPPKVAQSKYVTKIKSSFLRINLHVYFLKKVKNFMTNIDVRIPQMLKK